MAYDAENVFAKILRGELPCDKVYEDDDCLAFNDINPQAPRHILVIPKKPLVALGECGAEDEALLGKLLLAAGKIARQENLGDFRLIANSGAGAGQEVFHLHLHILAGGPLGGLVGR